MPGRIDTVKSGAVIFFRSSSTITSLAICRRLADANLAAHAGRARPYGLLCKGLFFSFLFERPRTAGAVPDRIFLAPTNRRARAITWPRSITLNRSAKQLAGARNVDAVRGCRSFVSRAGTHRPEGRAGARRRSGCACGVARQRDPSASEEIVIGITSTAKSLPNGAGLSAGRRLPDRIENTDVLQPVARTHDRPRRAAAQMPDPITRKALAGKLSHSFVSAMPD
jgi:hypothetical protein